MTVIIMFIVRVYYRDRHPSITLFYGTMCFCYNMCLLRCTAAKRRSMLYLGATLGSVLTIMFWAGILNLFLRSQFIFNIQLVTILLTIVLASTPCHPTRQLVCGLSRITDYRCMLFPAVRRSGDVLGLRHLWYVCVLPLM